MTAEQQTITEEVISRYRNWLLAGVPNPFNSSKWEWIKEVNQKIEELKKKLNANK